MPTILRQAGRQLVTLAEHYGMPADERVTDVCWLADTAQRGWAVLMKDKRIRRRPAEKTTVQQYAARCFCITRGDLTAEVMAERFISNLDAMATACASPGPFIYAVQATRLDLLKL